LAARGINRVRSKGGTEVARSFPDGGFLDELALFQEPMTIGPEGIEAVGGFPPTVLTRSFALVAQDTLGSDALSVYRRP
jgi:riboflavin biosynthesis pyrimidine reductase